MAYTEEELAELREKIKDEEDWTDDDLDTGVRLMSAERERRARARAGDKPRELLNELFREPEGVHAFIQWQGTEVCMDIHCPCGAALHLDAKFAFNVQCERCEKVYAVEPYVRLVELTEQEASRVLKRGTAVVARDAPRDNWVRENLLA